MTQQLQNSNRPRTSAGVQREMWMGRGARATARDAQLIQSGAGGAARHWASAAGAHQDHTAASGQQRARRELRSCACGCAAGPMTERQQTPRREMDPGKAVGQRDHGLWW